MKIGIIGLGWVGSSVAISVLNSGVASELLLNDGREGLAQGEAMDLAHGASFYPPTSIRACSIEEMRDADAVVIAAGKGGKQASSRLDLLKDNVGVMTELAEKLRGARGLVVIVTNPVDVMTVVMQRVADLPIERVIGTGTMLDTARIRQRLGTELALDPRSIHAYVIGEHGDSQVAVWSGVRIGGVRLSAWPSWSIGRQELIANEVRSAAYEIIKRKGATNHAIGLVTAALLRWALRGEPRILTVSRVQTGAFGLKNVALSLPTIVGSRGATEVLEIELSSQEKSALLRSGEILFAALRECKL